ncbi:hypothetical protein, partial [Bacillus altitudinis]|uniref:hypothetical protein n=1 Tax=Bacillus altitudinis TaxID=293387 RepID=UPI003B523D0F
WWNCKRKNILKCVVGWRKRIKQGGDVWSVVKNDEEKSDGCEDEKACVRVKGKEEETNEKDDGE